MKILMLGWEYPPHISGGLGTACEGLTTGLTRHGIDITFVVPSLFGDERAPHMKLIDAAGSSLGAQQNLVGLGEGARRSAAKEKLQQRLRTLKIPSLLSPYLRPETYAAARQAFPVVPPPAPGQTAIFDLSSEAPPVSALFDTERDEQYIHYGNDIFGEVARYAARVVAHVGDAEFDVIHAHDWMTYPAGVALSQLTGKPLVVHVHSLEYDRSGAAVNTHINAIESYGLQAAQAVIAVSYYTRSLIHERHGIPKERVHVVHNGVYPRTAVETYRARQQRDSKIVLFLGRVTFQKGPDYFVEAAARVIPHVPDVLFVMAGSGDMLPRMVERVHQLGISDNFEFPGFLRGQEVEQMYSLADVYVMPSVSEPFGISALEAISYDAPVIISKQSGVAEVLGHALKVDFWDLDRLADLIINTLLQPELREDITAMAKEELKRLRWDASALRTVDVYHKLTA